MMKNYKNILIVGHHNIGDVLHNMAILKPLATTFPKAKISMMTSPTGQTILENNPYLQKVITFHKHGKEKTLRGKVALIRTIRKKKFDLVVNLKSGSYMPYFFGAKKVWGVRSIDKKLVVKRNNHAIDIYLNTIREKGIHVQPEDLDMRVYYSGKDQKNIDQTLKSHAFNFQKPFVVVSPFSAWHAKQWAPELLGKLAQKIQSTHDMQVIFIGGPEDIPKMKELSAYALYYIDIVGKTSIKQLAALYEKARLIIGSDSGPFHLATNMNRPALGIFAPTSHLRARPYFLTENYVKCEKDLGCNPCIPGKHFMACDVFDRTTPCMEEISFSQVYTRVKHVLDQA